MLAQSAGYLVAVDARQADVHQGEIGFQRQRGAHAGHAVHRLVYFVAEQADQLAQHLPRVVVVLDHEDAAGGGGAGGGGRGAGTRVSTGRAMAGRRTVKVLPFPVPSLATATLPPCCSTRRRTSVSPIPSPPLLRSREWSPCTKMSKTRGRNSGAMPTPESRIESTASRPSGVTRTRISPPAGVYFTAFCSRFTI